MPQAAPAHALAAVGPVHAGETDDEEDSETLRDVKERVRSAIVERKRALDAEVAEGLARWHDLPRKVVFSP